MTATRIVIADDHAILRAGLRLLLSSHSDLTVVADVGDWPALVSASGALRPDVIVADLSMPGGDPFDGLRAIRRASDHSRVVVLTMHSQPDYFRAAMAAGSHGYVLKTSADDELLDAIRAVTAGQFFVSHALNTDDLAAPAADEQAGLATLSERERQVLRLAAQGLTSREIAEQVRLSVKTIESYRARMMAKLTLSSRSELVAFAVRHGMLTSADSSRRLD